MIQIIKSKFDMEHEPPIVTHNPDGTLTRKGAMLEARKKYGDLGMISSDDQIPYLVWKIGEFDRTVGRGLSWERALANARESAREEV